MDDEWREARVELRVASTLWHVLDCTPSLDALGEVRNVDRERMRAEEREKEKVRKMESTCDRQVGCRRRYALSVALLKPGVNPRRHHASAGHPRPKTRTCAS